MTYQFFDDTFINFYMIKEDENVYNIKQSKGNIPIDRFLLNNYSNVREIFDSVYNNYDDLLYIDCTLNILDIDFSNLKSQKMYMLSKRIFNHYHITNKFLNDKNEIIVSNRDIKHTVTYIYKTPGQTNLLKEHLYVFSNLGYIIKHAKLINQSCSNDVDTDDNSWHYYYDNLSINSEIYTLVFDVVSRNNGENHYRVQRFQKNEIFCWEHCLTT